MLELGEIMPNGTKMGVKAVQIPSDSELQKAGEFQYYLVHKDSQKYSGMTFMCPCGCSRPCSISFSTSRVHSPTWEWNGNIEAPTVTPSIRRLDGCKWHGWITEGEFYVA